MSRNDNVFYYLSKKFYRYQTDQDTYRLMKRSKKWWTPGSLPGTFYMVLDVMLYVYYKYTAHLPMIKEMSHALYTPLLTGD